MDPEISHNIRQIQQATGSVVQISAFLVSALGTMTYNIGKKVAPHVIYQGQKVSELFVNTWPQNTFGQNNQLLKIICWGSLCLLMNDYQIIPVSI